MMEPINSFTRFLLKNQPKGYVPKHDQSLINLSNLENVLGFSPNVKKMLEGIDWQMINGYGDRTGNELKKKISQWLQISTDMISLGNGSDELIDFIPRIFLDPGEIVVPQAPTFFRVIEASLRMKGKMQLVKAKEEKGFSVDNEFIDEMISNIKKLNPKITWLCSPCNPTGEVITLGMTDKIAQASQGIVIVDEVYQELYDPENRQSAIHLLSKHKNILVLKSFSKAFGLAGIRVGFVVGDNNIIEIFEKTRLNFNVNIISQQIAQIALDDLDFLKSCSSFFRRERAWLFAEINKISNLIIGADSKINVFILKHKSKDIFEELFKKRILTADFRQANGLEGKGFVRVTIKTRKENKLLLKALREIN